MWMTMDYKLGMPVYHLYVEGMGYVDMIMKDNVISKLEEIKGICKEGVENMQKTLTNKKCL